MLPDNWLFATHDKSEVSHWVKSLKYGFFKRAWGGHANDGDSFELWLRYQSEEELHYILAKLGIELQLIPESHPRPETNKSYHWQEYQKFKLEIKDFPQYEQPLKTTIAGIPVFCWVENGKISISLSGSHNGNSYEVGNEDFRNLLTIEALIEHENLTNFVMTDLSRCSTCVTSTNYPEFKETTTHNKS